MTMDFSLLTQHLNRIEDKIDRLNDDCSSINVKVEKQGVILERNTDSLVEHMRRTDLLEKKLGHVEDHVLKVETTWGNIKIIAGIVVTLTGAVWTIVHYFIK